MGAVEEIAALTERRQGLSSELASCRSVVSGLIKKGNDHKTTATKAQKNLQDLYQIKKHMRGEALIVSLPEYREVKRLAQRNVEILSETRKEIAALIQETRAQKARLAALEAQLEQTAQALSRYGKVLQGNFR